MHFESYLWIKRNFSFLSIALYYGNSHMLNISFLFEIGFRHSMFLTFKLPYFKRKYKYHFKEIYTNIKSDITCKIEYTNQLNQVVSCSNSWITQWFLWSHSYHLSYVDHLNIIYILVSLINIIISYYTRKWLIGEQFRLSSVIKHISIFPRICVSYDNDQNKN